MGHILCGAAKVNITPPADLIPDLYGLMKKRFAGVIDELFVRAMYLSDENEQLLFMSWDLDKAPVPEVIIPELVRLVEAYDYTDKVIFGIPSPKFIPVIRGLNPAISILSFGDKDKTDAFIEAEIDYIRLWEAWLEPELVAKVKESKSKLWVMSGIKGTVGYPTEEGLRKILSFEPDGILVNDVRILK